MERNLHPRWPQFPSLPALVHWAQSFFLTLGILALGYCAILFADASFSQFEQSRLFEKMSQAGSHSAALTVPHAPFEFSSTDEPLIAAVQEGTPWGRIELIRLGLSVMIAEGDDEKTLRRGVGHIPGTALPGQPGNVGLAAHRDTYFRPLENIRVHDEIFLTTLAGVYRYRVQSLEVVGPKDIQVLDPQGGQTLTLVTCYPFHFVGSAPHRFIVHAQRIDH